MTTVFCSFTNDGMTGADLRGANLISANLTKAIPLTTGLTDANLDGSIG